METISSTSSVADLRDALDTIRHDHPGAEQRITAARCALVDATVSDERTKVDTLKRHRPRDADALAAARLELATARRHAWITSLVVEAPPLTEQQCAKLNVLLWGDRPHV